MEDSIINLAAEIPAPTTLELWLGFRYITEPLTFAKLLKLTSDWLWGMPLLVLLIGGGLFFTIYSRFTPFLHLWHSIQILRELDYDEDQIAALVQDSVTKTTT